MRNLLGLLQYLSPKGGLAEVTAHLDAGGDPRVHDNTALRWACYVGNFDLVERLITGNQGTSEYPGLTAADARAHENYALRAACAFGYLNVLDRLLALGLTADDARAYDNEALRTSCSRGYLAVLERLISLGLTADDARADDNYALRASEHRAVVARLLELGVEPTPAALVCLCHRGRLRSSQASEDGDDDDGDDDDGDDDDGDDDDGEWTRRLWRAVERWDGSPDLQVAESGLTPPQLEAWETAKVRACPRGLRFVD